MYVCKDNIRWRFAVGADAGSGLVAEMDIWFFYSWSSILRVKSSHRS